MLNIPSIINTQVKSIPKLIFFKINQCFILEIRVSIKATVNQQTLTQTDSYFSGRAPPSHHVGRGMTSIQQQIYAKGTQGRMNK